MKGFGLTVAALLAMAAPALAQFGSPLGGYGSPGLYAAPEGSAGAIGAGAGNSAATQQQCTQIPGGRNGPQTYCSSNSPAPNPSRR